MKNSLIIFKMTKTKNVNETFIEGSNPKFYKSILSKKFYILFKN